MPSVPSAPSFPAFLPPTGTAETAAVSSPGTTPESQCPAFVTPKLAQTFTAPALNGISQLYSLCAYLWAIPGATLYFPPFGLVNINGVSGDVITFQNISITPGQIIQAGTMMLQGAPLAATTSQLQASLDRQRGYLNGADSYIVGTANQLNRWNQVGVNVLLQPTAGMIFFPNPNYNLEISSEDVGGAALATTPIATANAGVTAYYDLPNLPAANLLPATFYARVHIRLSVAAIDTVAANRFSVEHNSVEVGSMTYQFEEHYEVVLPVTGTRLRLDYTKLNNKANCFARVRVIGYYF